MSENKRTKRFFHATSMQAFQRMMQGGSIRASNDTGVVSNGIVKGEPEKSQGIYLSDNVDDISHLHENAVKNTTFDPNLPNSGVLLDIEVDVDKLQPDRNDPHAYPEHQDDAERGQVKHLGDIDVNRIREVGFTYPMKSGAYMESLNVGLAESREFIKKYDVGKMKSLDEAVAIIDSQNEHVVNRYKPLYEKRVMDEQVHCQDNDLERLRLVHAHKAGDGTQQLAITQLNDLDLLAEGATHKESPMLFYAGDDLKTRHHKTYSQEDFDKIMQGSDRDGVFLAKTEPAKPNALFGSRHGRVVSALTVERSALSLVQDKHESNTKAMKNAKELMAFGPRKENVEADADWDSGLSL